MTALRISWPKTYLAFAPEWIALAALALANAVWAQVIGFRLILTWQDLKMPALVLALALIQRGFGWMRGALASELLGLWLVMAGIFQVLSYLCMASSGTLIDPQLQTMDRLLHFNWLENFRLVLAHPKVLWVFSKLYNSVTWQALYFCVLMGLMNRADRMRELFWIVFLCAIITDLAAVPFPALGPFQEFGLQRYGSFLPDMQRLISHHDLRFALAELTGVISFPSFHTILALAFAYGFRNSGLIGYVMATLNALLLISVPIIGGHYLSDVLGGVCVFAIVALGMRLRARGLPTANRSPDRWSSLPSAAASGRQG